MLKTRIITTPIRLTGSVHPEQLGALVAIDAMARRWALLGQQPPSVQLTAVVGDAAVQRAVQRVVIKEGDDQEELGREGFASRARQLESDALAKLEELLSALGVSASFSGLAAGAGGGESAIQTARVAFVRLFEAGVLARTDAVLDSCPSCETVVDDADADDIDLEISHVRVALPLADGVLEIDVAEPELWVGAVALAVPTHFSIVDSVINLPLLEAEIPIITIEGIEAPVVVVPGHDRWSHELARQLNLPIVEVLDGEGVVRHSGPLEGLGRYAAREAATEQLAHEGYVIAHFEAMQTAKKCHRCGTVLVPLFGRHWIMNLGALAEPVVEMIRSGAVEFQPQIAQDQLLSICEQAGQWCVSQQLWSGQGIPVSTCLDCGQTRVSVDEDMSCGSCMGTLQPHTDVLDARFVTAVAPLSLMGWPNDIEAPEEVTTILSVGRVGLDAWALPIAALGLRLANVVPFSQVILHQTPIGAEESGQMPTSDVIELIQVNGPRHVRAALLAGDLDLVRAKETVALLDDPPVGEQDLREVVESYDKALSLLDAGGAMALLANAAKQGVSPESIGDLDVFRRPLLGE